MSKWVRLYLLAGTAWFVPAFLMAQTRATTADLAGVVTDQTRAVLPGATVTATNPETNLERSAITRADGSFTIPALPPGTYSVRSELPGFTPQRQDSVLMLLGTTTDLEIVLPVAPQQAEVTVIGRAPLVDTGKTAVATVVSQRQIENLPINGRNFISFSVIAPGVSTDRTPQQGASATSGLTFAGQRARSNNISVDGLDNNDITIGSVRATFSQEAVQEFQVIANSFSAEFGKASGGVVNIVTKSGTNRVAGNVFGFFRDDHLNAKEYFEKFTPAGASIDRPKAPYDQQQYGGTLGGPIRKDRTFLFASFERMETRANNFVTIDDRTPVTLFGRPVGTAADILRAAGFPVVTGNVPYAIKSDQFLIRGDHGLTKSQTQHLAVRYNYADGLNENIEPWGGLTARSRGAVLDSKDHMLAVSHMAVLSSRLVSENRFQYARRDQQVNALDPACGGPCVREDQGGPTLEVLGAASVGRHRFTPQPRLNDRYQVLDTLSYFLGAHQFKGGVDWNFVDHKLQSLPLHFGGRYIFSPVPAIPGLLPLPITAIQAVAAGVPAAYVQGYGLSSATYGYYDLSLFAQDDWRVGPNLTAKLGVRYQRQFWPEGTYSVPGYGSFDFPADADNWAPRLAVAWDPMGDKRTALHGSYGLFFDNHITGVAGITRIVDGSSTGLRTLASRLSPTSLLPIAAWNAPGHRLPESAVPAFPSLVIAIDPGLKTPYAHHVAVGVDRELPSEMAVSANFVYVRGHDQLGTIDYNPVLTFALGPGRRPLDVGGRAGTSASVLQYTSFGETWYRGLTLALTKRFAGRYQFLASYTLSKAEDTSTDFQSQFVPQDNGLGRNPNNQEGLPAGFDPMSEKGASVQDQRHRFVLSGIYLAPGDLQLSAIVTAASGRPFNILAGADLNQDGDGGAASPDRARGVLTNQSTAAGRNAGVLPSEATVDLRVARRFPLGGPVSLDAMFEVFNLFNRTNFTEVNNVFGTGSYPTQPLPTYGQFVQAGPPRQVQLGVKINW